MILEDKLNKRDNFNLYIIVGIVSGIIGFIYEEIFYYFDLGKIVKRGSTFGPWIPIYFFGGLFITFLTYKKRSKPLVVFLLSLLITGILEYGTALVLDKIFNMRLWDYNTEILNYLNINGYICLRSVLLFGFAGLFLIYTLIPRIIKLIQKSNKKYLNFSCNLLIIIFFLDIILYMIFK